MTAASLKPIPAGTFLADAGKFAYLIESDGNKVKSKFQKSTNMRAILKELYCPDYTRFIVPANYGNSH